MAMTSHRLSPQPQDSFDGSTSVFLRSVSLYDWWLIRPENNESDVGVAGFTSPKDGLVRRPVRVFKSVPITKVYNIFTLETADNVTVLLNGYSNSSRTAANGFPSEVCNQFVMGFPAHWEKLVAEEGTSADMDSQVTDQVGPSKKSQKSPRRQKGKKESQPEIESQVANSVCRSKKDQTSPGKENQPSTRTKRTLFPENIAGGLSSDLPEDAMEEVRMYPLASALVKFASSSHHHVDQITPGKIDQASPGNHKTAETPSQIGMEPSSAPPLVKLRRSSRRQIGTLGKGNVRRQTTSVPQKKEMVSRSKNDQKSSSRQKSKKDQKSSMGQKSKKENQPSTRKKGDCFTENAAGDLGSDLPGDAMDEVGEDPSPASPLVKSKLSSYHLIDQSSLGVKDQTSTGEEDQTSARTISHYDTECTRNHLSPDQPRDDIEVSREEPSSAPPPLKPQISSLHHIDQTTPSKKREASTGKHKSVRKASQTVEEPSSAPPLVKPRRPHCRQIGKGDVRRQTTTPVATPQTDGSFKRSRSGRILLPPLAFWRNELAVYDAKGNIVEVQGLDMAADPKSKDTGKKSRRK